MPKYDFKKVAKQLIEIVLRHECFPVNLVHIFRTPFYRFRLLVDNKLLVAMV